MLRCGENESVWGAPNREKEGFWGWYPKLFTIWPLVTHASRISQLVASSVHATVELSWTEPWFPGDAVVKNPPANAGDTRDSGLIPGSEDPVRKEMATHSSILAWKSPWTASRLYAPEKYWIGPSLEALSENQKWPSNFRKVLLWIKWEPPKFVRGTFNQTSMLPQNFVIHNYLFHCNVTLSYLMNISTSQKGKKIVNLSIRSNGQVGSLPSKLLHC